MQVIAYIRKTIYMCLFKVNNGSDEFINFKIEKNSFAETELILLIAMKTHETRWWKYELGCTDSLLQKFIKFIKLFAFFAFGISHSDDIENNYKHQYDNSPIPCYRSKKQTI